MSHLPDQIDTEESEFLRAGGKKLKIARVIARLNVGGPARQACFLHERLRDRFHTLLIIGVVDHGEADMSYLLQSNRGVLRLNRMSKSIRLWDDLITFFRLCILLKRENPDILHTHTAKAGALGRIAGFLVGVPVIVHTYHGHVFNGYFGPAKTRFFVTIEKFLNRLTTTVIAISDSQARELSEVHGVAERTNISVIPTGHDLSSYLNSKPKGRLREQLNFQEKNKKIVVWAGRMVPIKNTRLLAEIVRTARTEAPELHFVVIGDGPDRPIFQDLTSGCSNYTWLGWIEDMSEIWPDADIAMGTSLNEGTPAVFIEAMAAGKPFVSTAVGGVFDLAVNPRTMEDGFIADNCILCASSAEALLRCLLEIARNPVLASAMGECGRAFVMRNHTAERLAENVSRLYGHLAMQSLCRG